MSTVGAQYGAYRLIKKLGEGGMGSVWEAVHCDLGTPAAIKLISGNIDAEALARFKREAQAAASLRSVNVVQILDYQVQDGTPFIAMEFLEGETLGERLARQRVIQPDELAWVLRQVAKAIDLAHGKGIVHRDLKPDNIFLARDGDDEIVKVLDFGIAKVHGSTHLTGGVTGPNSVLGTPWYLSPEQASGQRPTDRRSDIWAFGVIAFECLLGKRPFQADALGALLLAICAEPIPVPSSVGSVPEGFDRWFAATSERDPDRRTQSIRDAADQLSLVCGQVPTPRGGTMRPSDAGAALATGSVTPPRRSRLALVFGVISITLAAGLVALFAVRRSSPETGPETARAENTADADISDNSAAVSADAGASESGPTPDSGVAPVTSSSSAPDAATPESPTPPPAIRNKPRAPTPTATPTPPPGPPKAPKPPRTRPKPPRPKPPSVDDDAIGF